MSIDAGSRLGPYEIVALIGAGGMGEVYRARDHKLNRDVALKVLPTLVAGDADRLSRFQREAQVLAALNHPNIAQIYGFEDSGSTHALVMELVDGATLAEAIAAASTSGSGIPRADAVPIARQIAEALEAAHELGIIHRDLKPANVKVRPDGTVKVLDFGLAKALDPGGGSSVDGMNSPTLTARATQLGVILGTAAYMSPEQAKGKPVDRRADIWAFGVVLYEMLTGDRTFKGEDISDTLASVLRQDVDWKALPAGTPPRLKRLIERCLDRDVKTRLRDIGEARIELARLESGATDASDAVVDPSGGATLAIPAPPARQTRTALLAALAGVALTAAVAWALVHFAPQPKAQPIRFAFAPPAAAAIASSTVDRQIAISPAGTHIAYISGDGSLMLRAIDGLEAEPIPGITGARVPFFSHDGQWIGFAQGASELRKVSITGGPSVPICSIAAPPRGASWGADNVIVFATASTSTGLMSVPAGGGEPKTLTRPDPAKAEADHQHPSVLPGGRAVLFTITAANSQVDVAVLDLTTGVYTTLVRGGSQPEYVESPGGPGTLVYAAAGSLRAVAFDVKTLEVESDPVPVVDRVWTVATGAAQFSSSRTGTLAYLPGGLDSSSLTRLLFWVDRKGHEEPIRVPARAYSSLRLAPDGTRVALDTRDQQNDIWVWHFDRQTLTPITFDPGMDTNPVWTPDSTRILFSSSRGGTNQNIFAQAADGTGAPERLTTSDRSQRPSSISSDGQILVFQDQGPNSEDVAMLPMDGKTPATALIHSNAIERNGDLSPDRRWLAYESFESTPPQIYIRPFPDVNSGKWQISTSGGVKPVWASSGKELFYFYANAIWAVSIATTPSAAGNPVKLFDLPNMASLLSARFFDVSRDGRRFIVIKDPVAAGTTTAPLRSMVVVVNWFEELKAKIGK